MMSVISWRRAVQLFTALVLALIVTVPYDPPSANAQIGIGRQGRKIDTTGFHSLLLKADGTVVAWGSQNNNGETNVPEGLSDVTGVAAGKHHSLALRSDGTVVAWGYNSSGQTDVPDGLSDVVAISAGAFYSLALRSDGTVVAWGDGSEGQTNVPNWLSDVVAISAGMSHALALKADGTVVSWGSDHQGKATVPDGLSDVVAIAAGGYHSLALRSDGTVVAWGGGSEGQTNVPNWLSDVVAIAAGDTHSLALRSDGTVVGWGSNGYNEATAPVGLSDVVEIAAGMFHSLALKADGTVVIWGDSSLNQKNVPAGLEIPVKVTAAAGWYHTLALRSDGTLDAWGHNTHGQIDVPDELQDPATAKVTAIEAGFEHSVALRSDGTVVAWGRSSEGQIDVLPGLQDPDNANVKSIAAGAFHSLALKFDGTVHAWGYNLRGQIDVPDELQDPATAKVKTIAAGYEHSVALRSDGTVVVWGSDFNDQKKLPAGLSEVKAIAAGSYHTLALKEDGTVVAWGYNNDGQTNVPAELIDPATAKVKAIAAGQYHSVALRSDGTVVVWGDGSRNQKKMPEGLSGVKAIAAGSYHTLALRADGIIVAWGDDQFGQTAGEVKLSGLTVQEGSLAPAFYPNVTEYNVYIGPSVSEVHITATLADSENSALYINNQPQTSGSVATVNITGETTVINVRVESSLLSVSYMITVLQDSTPPLVQFGTNGNASPAITAESIVNVTDAGIGVDEDSLQYAWSQSTVAPVDGWKPFANGDKLELTSGDGDWYLHIRAQDALGNVTEAVTNVFVLDNTAPVVQFGANGNPSPAKTAESTVTVTDAQSGVDGDSLQYAWTQSTDTPADGWTDFVSGETLELTSGDGDWFLHIRAQDALGNVTEAVSDVFVLDNKAPVLTLNGSNPMNIPHGGTYTEPGAVAIDAIDGDISSSVVITGAVDTAKLGYYLLHYEVADRAENVATVTRSVYVYDGDAPAIMLNGANLMTVEAGSTFVDPGATAWDSQDGDISDSIVVTGTVDMMLLGAYTLHYDVFDSAGNAAVTVTRSVYVTDTQPPVLMLLGDPVMSVPYGETFIDPGAQATDTYYGDLSALIVVTGAVDTGKAGHYTLYYNVQDPSGNAAAEVTRTVRVMPKKSSSAANAPRPFIDNNGILIDPTAIDTSKPNAALDVSPKDGAAYVRIPAAVLAGYADNNDEFLIELRTPYGSLQVPVRLASLIPGLTDLLAANNLDAADISFKFILTDKSGDRNIRAALAESLPNSTEMGAIVDFRIEIVDDRTGQAVKTADKFSDELVRMIPLPESMSAVPEMWGAFRYNETSGKFEFVPARLIRIDGVWVVMIRSYSNSVYVVAHNAVNFTDVQEHWGQPYIRLAAAKGLVSGIGDKRYAPDKAVTRAEFAAMLVRALGRDAVSGGQPYSDVWRGAWYYDAVAAAKSLGLLDFASETRFKPNQPLTREELASMLAAVADLENPAAAEEDVNLDRYKDIGSVDAAYVEDVRTVVGLEIMTGTGADTFSPKDNVTRAQAAVVLIKALQALGWIDAA